MRSSGRRRRRGGILGATIIGAVALVAPALAPAAAGAAPREVSHGIAPRIDGSAADWTAADAFGELVRDGDKDHVVAEVSVRYDCAATTLSVLVTAVPGEVIQTIDPAESYVRLGATGKLVSGLDTDSLALPSFEWLGSGPTAAGFEAAFELAPGAYRGQFRVHSKTPDTSPDGYDTLDLRVRHSDLVVSCSSGPDPTDLDPEPTATTVPGGGVGSGGLTNLPDGAAGAGGTRLGGSGGIRRGSLPRTGSDVVRAVPVGLVLVLLGTALVVRGRRYRIPSS